MYNKQLDTFNMVVEQGSFSKAAAQLYITPSAVIQQINSLEDDLQVKLFTRSKHGVKLTEAGQILFREGRELISRSEAIRAQFDELQNKKEKELCIGTNLLHKCRLFYELWMRFEGARKGYSVRMKDLQFRVNEMEGIDIVEGVFLRYRVEG